MRDPSHTLGWARRQTKRLLAYWLWHRGARIAILRPSGSPEPVAHARRTFLTLEDPPLIENSLALVAVQLVRHRYHALAAENRAMVGVVGAITARKNVLAVAQACKLLQTKLMVAGKVSKWAEAEMCGARAILGDCLIVRDEFMTDLELISVLASLDVCVVAHRNRGPSGVVALARLIGIRIVLAGKAAELAIGSEISTPSLDGREIARCIAKSLAAQPPLPLGDPSVPQARFRSFFLE